MKKCIYCTKYKATKRGKRDSLQRFKCLACEKWFVENQRVEDNNLLAVESLVNDHLDGISYRKLTSRYAIGKSQLCETVNKFVSTLKHNIEITKEFFDQTSYSGNHVVDGKYIPVKEEILVGGTGKIPKSKKRRKVQRGIVLVWGADYGTHDIPVHEFGRSEDQITFKKYFGHLKSIGYKMLSCTIDDKREIMFGILFHYPFCKIQLCIKHYLSKVSRKLVVQNVRAQINTKQKRINQLFVYPQRDYVPTSRQDSLRELIKLNNEITDLEFSNELLLDFQDIIRSIVSADNYQTALYKIESLRKYFLPKRLKMKYPNEQIKKVKKLYKDFQLNKEYLLSYLKYPDLNIPATTNLIEGYNSHLELRLSSIRGFESIQTAKNYINAWILKRRFTKFTCCRKSFRQLNGKTPLECAGVDSSAILNWIVQCRKKAK